MGLLLFKLKASRRGLHVRGDVVTVPRHSARAVALKADAAWTNGHSIAGHQSKTGATAPPSSSAAQRTYTNVVNGLRELARQVRAMSPDDQRIYGTKVLDNDDTIGELLEAVLGPAEEAASAVRAATPRDDDDDDIDDTIPPDVFEVMADMLVAVDADPRAHTIGALWDQAKACSLDLGEPPRTKAAAVAAITEGLRATSAVAPAPTAPEAVAPATTAPEAVADGPDARTGAAITPPGPKDLGDET